MRGKRLWTGAVLPVLGSLGLSAVAAPPTSQPAAYRDHSTLSKWIEQLAVSHSQVCRIEAVSSSRGGREVQAIRIARPGAGRPEDRPALLIVAGLDGEHVVGSETAARVAERLLGAPDDSQAARLLTEYTVYVVPRVNPDAQEAFFTPPLAEVTAAPRPVDDDRDGRVDEDGPEDLNGDGLITLMRVKDPEATHLPDPVEPRLLREPDRAKGQRPIYRVYAEGLDNDGDGEYTEDPVGGVELNRNFPHGYAEHTAGSGPHQVSEPESRGLIDFVIGHPRIAAVITYGRHNNLIETPKGEQKDATGQAPVELHKDDVAIFEAIGKRYRDLAKVKKAPKSDWAGAFFAWAYAQYGIPSFATTVWFRPDSEDKKPTTEPPATQPASQPSTGPATRPGEEKKDEEKAADEEAAAWLKYSDAQRSGEGFIPWTAFKHPTLGEVEIGGFRPFFRANPPADEINGLAGREFEFAVELLSKLPKLAIRVLSVRMPGDGVFEIEVGIVNEGHFPTALAMAQQNRRVRPLVVRLDVPPEHLLGGPWVETVWSIPGSGGMHKVRWVVAGARSSAVLVKVTSEKYGDFSQSVKLETSEASHP